MENEQAVKELACKICDEEDGFGICERKPDEENCRTQLLFARRVLAAGYRKIEPKSGYQEPEIEFAPNNPRFDRPF